MALKIVRNNIKNMKTDAIINTVNPEPIFGSGVDYAIYEEEKLREFYRKSLNMAKENGCKSISFPVTTAGCFGNTNEEGMIMKRKLLLTTRLVTL